MAVALQLRKYYDNIAKKRQAVQEALDGSVRLVTIADAAEDETFEHRVDVTALTNADDAIEASAVFRDSVVKNAITLPNDYFRVDLDLASPVLAAYLASVGYRIAWEANEAAFESSGLRVASHLVFPKGTMVADDAQPTTAGMHRFGRLTGMAGASTYAAVDGVLDTAKIIAAPVLAVAALADPGGPPTMTFVLQDATTKNIAVPLASDAVQWKHGVVGKQAIVSVDGATFTLAATAQFKGGEYVLLWENVDGNTSIREVAQVKTVLGTPTFTVEMESTPVNTFTAAGFVIPMFTRPSAFVSGNLTNNKLVDFYALPDRIITML